MNILDKDYKMKVTPEQSRAVQEACFANGIVWKSKNNEVLYLNEPYLIIRGFFITYLSDKEGFAESNCQCIEPEAFISMLNDKPESHPHAELMAQYAKDAAETKTPWERWEYFSDTLGVWESCIDHPYWTTRTLFRRKSDTIKVGKHEFPRPMRTAPSKGVRYWYVEMYSYGTEVSSDIWANHEIDYNRLNANLCHCSEDEGKKHVDVLNSINRGDIE